MKVLSRLSLNQRTINRWSLPEAIEGCVRHGIGHIGIWRDKLAERPLHTTAQQLRDANLKVSSLCRGGFFSAPTPAARAAQIEDNRRAIDECAAIGAPVLVLVTGPPNGQTLPDARAAVRDGIAELAPYAAQHGIKLGIEPLHPMYAAERSVILTLKEANDLAAQFPAESVGVVFDVFHLWWDADIAEQTARAGNRILGFHVSDWLVPLPDMLLGRGLMGDGVIDIPSLHALVSSAGYTGPIEVEIFNQALWDTDPDEALGHVCRAFLQHV